MSKRLQLIAILLAGLLSTGAQWDALQGLAWGRMLMQAASSGASLRVALEETFAGELCELCEVVDAGRQAQQDLPATAAAPKAAKLLLCTYTSLVFEFSEMPGPSTGPWSLSDQVASSAERPSPPFPPPKLRAV